MNRMRMIALACCTLGVLWLPQAAFADGPATDPVMLLNEGFETEPVSYSTTPYTSLSVDGSVYGYWGRWTSQHRNGLSSLWCGTTRPATDATSYAERSAGHATFPVEAADFYSTSASFWYVMPSFGHSDRDSFVPQWTNDPTGSYGTGATIDKTSSWVQCVVNLSTPNPLFQYENLSRSAGVFRLQWIDHVERDPESGDPYIHTGEGPSVDDLTITGWKYGPVRGLAATVATGSVTLKWVRPWRSTAATSTEERALTYRVWRAPANTTDWTELTRASAPSYTDLTVEEATEYTYAVQAWDVGAGPGYGERAQVEVITKAFTVPLVSISAPSPGAVITGTGPATVTGTAVGQEGSTIVSASVTVRRSDNTYLNGATGTWTPTPSSVSAVLTGDSWSASWTPPRNEYLSHTYTITAAATDSRGKKATTPARSVRVDSVPYVAPAVTITAPTAGATLVAPFEITGSVRVQSGLPAASVRLEISRGPASWWNGSTWVSARTSVPAAVTGESWRLSVKPQAGADAYTVVATASDAHGLSGYSPPRAFSVHVVPDNAPLLVGARSLGRHGVELRFSKPVAMGGIAPRFAITAPDGRNLVPSVRASLTWSADRTRVRVATRPQVVGKRYTASVTGLTDARGNVSVLKSMPIRPRP